MYVIMSLIIGDAVDVQTALRPALLPCDIRRANAEQPFRAKEVNSMTSRDQLHRSKQGLKCCEWLMSHEWSSCDHCSHLWLGLSVVTV